jgi:phage tail-like protein
MADRVDPYRQFRFIVEFDGKEMGGFTECTFADTSTDSIEYREGNELPIFRKLSGLTKYGNITLKWGITDSMDLYNWRKDVIAKGAEKNRKSMSIVLVNEAGEKKARWNIAQAWPIKYDPSDFSSKANEVAIESLEIAHEGFTRDS